MGNFALLSIDKRGYDAVIVFWMVLIHVLCLLAPVAFSWSALSVCLVLYVFTVGCVSIGYHRLFSHRSYQTYKWVERLLAIGGTMSMQGSVIEWVAHHRMHHAHSDTDGDPHNAKAGFWYSHMFWVPLRTPAFDDATLLRRFARDVHADPFLRFMSRLDVMLGLQLAVGAALYAAGGWDFVVWGYFVRMVLTHHSIWLVNSAAHRWGYRNYDTKDATKNCWWVSIFAFGEGWHNNHHAEPDNPSNSRHWWEIDVGAMVIEVIRSDKGVSEPPSSNDKPAA